MGVWQTMNDFITKTKFSIDLEKIIADLDQLLQIYPWPEMNIHTGLAGHQIGLTHRPDAKDVFLDAAGSLYDKETKKFIGKESDFTLWNAATPQYTRNILEQLSEHENTKFGRIRFMRLMPKTGLSVHPDFEKRYHLAVRTNRYAYFGHHIGQDVAAQCYHVPADGYFYKVDTTKEHFVYNGGWEPRVHLVICEAL